MKTADMFIKRRRLIKRLLVLVLCVSAVYGALRIYWALWPGIQRARLTRQTMADVGSPSDYFPTVSGQPKETRVVTRLGWHRNSGGSRGFSHLRGQMEDEDVIPAMGGDFRFACQACYQGSGDVDAVRGQRSYGGDTGPVRSVSASTKFLHSATAKASGGRSG